MLSSNPQKVTLNNGQETEVTMHLFETARYVLMLETPDNELLTSTATAEVLDFPEPFIKQIPLGRYTGTMGKNLAQIEIPSTTRRVLLSVPGFWPVEFNPVAMAIDEAEALEKKITIKLTPQ